MTGDPKRLISIVVPVYNEEENIPFLFEAIDREMKKAGLSYEAILIDDGSKDASAAKIKELQSRYPAFRLISFRRNFGQTAALSAGFEHASGEIIVAMDADLQNDPADIPVLIQKLDEGFDLASGWRKKRQDSWIRNFPSHMANQMISSVTGVKLHDSGCTLKAYKREVVKELKLYGEMHRFIPALASWMGVSVVEVPVHHSPRLRGKSKYGLSRTLRVFLDLLTVKFLLSYSTSPIQIFGKIGVFSSFFGFLVFAGAVFLKFSQHRTLTGNPMFYVFIFMEMIAIQFILIGLLAEINIRTYHESQKKKTYVIKEIR